MLLLNRSTEPMDIPINECRGAFQVLQGGLVLGTEKQPVSKSADTLFYPERLPQLSLLEFVLPAPTQVSANSAMIITCNSSKQKQNYETVIVNIDGDETKSPRLVGSLPELGGWNPTEVLPRRGQVNDGVPKSHCLLIKSPPLKSSIKQTMDSSGRMVAIDSYTPIRTNRFGYDKF